MSTTGSAFAPTASSTLLEWVYVDAGVFGGERWGRRQGEGVDPVAHAAPAPPAARAVVGEAPPAPNPPASPPPAPRVAAATTRAPLVQARSIEPVVSLRPKDRVPAPRLPRVREARDGEELRRLLNSMENETISLAGVTREFAQGVTGALGRLPETRRERVVYPVGVYHFIVAEAARGRDKRTASENLAASHQNEGIRKLSALPRPRPRCSDPVIARAVAGAAGANRPREPAADAGWRCRSEGVRCPGCGREGRAIPVK